MTDKTQLLPVTQEDRDEAAKFLRGVYGEHSFDSLWAPTIERGAADWHAIVRLVAAARISHSLPGDVGCCDCSIREALVGMVENFAPPITDHNPALLAKIEAHETALRALAALTTTTGQSTTPLLEEEV